MKINHHTGIFKIYYRWYNILKKMQFMSQQSHSQKLVSFFAKFIPSEILTLAEILFCHVKIIFLLFIYRNYAAKSRPSRNKFFTQKGNKSELQSLIITKFCPNYLHDALNKNTYRK